MSDDVTVLRDPKRWKAVAHPLRLGILRELADGAMTNEELAHALGKPSGALFYHTKRLLDAGLIETAGTRAKGPITEKLYRRAAASYEIPIVEDGTAPPLSGLIRNGLEVYESTWREKGGGDFDQVGFNLVYEVSEETEAEFFRIVSELGRRFPAATTGAPGHRLVSFTMLIHRVSGPD